MNALSPSVLKFLLHCYSQPDNTEFDLRPYAQEAAGWIEMGILKRDSPWGSTPAAGYIYRTTELGNAWVKAILKTPLPKSVFVDATGAVIE